MWTVLRDKFRPFSGQYFFLKIIKLSDHRVLDVCALHEITFLKMHSSRAIQRDGVEKRQLSQRFLIFLRRVLPAINYRRRKSLLRDDTTLSLECSRDSGSKINILRNFY